LESALPSSVERDEIKQLRAALKRVEIERDTLKSLDHLLPIASVMSRYAFIAACAEPWPVQVLYQVLAVSTDGFTSSSNGRPPRRLRGKW
jgi:hypothetical protein